jgi:hypothetical protein
LRKLDLKKSGCSEIPNNHSIESITLKKFGISEFQKRGTGDFYFTTTQQLSWIIRMKADNYDAGIIIYLPTAHMAMHPPLL